MSHGSLLRDCFVDTSIIGIRSRIDKGVEMKVRAGDAWLGGVLLPPGQRFRTRRVACWKAAPPITQPVDASLQCAGGPHDGAGLL